MYLAVWDSTPEKYAKPIKILKIVITSRHVNSIYGYIKCARSIENL